MAKLFLLLIGLSSAVALFDLPPLEEVDSSEFGGPAGIRETTCPCGWANKGKNAHARGVQTEIHEYPFMAKVKLGRKECGGTIISSKHILIATHCTYGTLPSEVTVTVGEHHTVLGDEHTQTLKVSKIIEHPEYSPVTLKNDISVLVLSSAITFNQYIGPVCIPTQELPLENKSVKVMGRGQKKSLHSLNLRVISAESCTTFWKKLVASDQFCTYGKDKTTYTDDSGGPIVWLDSETNRYTLAGLVSFGDTVGISTKVSSYYAWINDIVTSKSWWQSSSKVGKVCIKK